MTYCAGFKLVVRYSSRSYFAKKIKKSDYGTNKMGDKIKVQSLDPRSQEFVTSIINAKNLPSIKDIIQSLTDDEIPPDCRHGEVAEVFNRFRSMSQGGLSGAYGRFGDDGYLLPSSYQEDAEKIRNMAVRPDDVWLVTFPRSGTTWTQELVWLLKNDLDYDTALKIPLEQRYTMFEKSNIFSNRPVASKQEIGQVLASLAKPTLSFEAVATTASPRFIKTHLPLSLLPRNLVDTAKVVFVARDPRDVAVSYYHLAKTYFMYQGDFKTYWNLFVNDLVLYAPFFPRLKEALALRHHPNMLLLRYEDMLKDLPSSIKRVASFLGKELTDEQLVKLCKHLHIENFRKNPSVCPGTYSRAPKEFVREGKAGGWCAHFDEEMAAQAQAWMRENLAGCDLRFPDDGASE